VSIDQNKTSADRFVKEVVNTGSFARANEFFADNYVDHAAPPRVPPDLDGLKLFFSGFRTAFPDLHYTVDLTVAEGDLVVERLTGHGTMKGPFQGMPPSGKSATWAEIHTTRMGPNGKFVEHWANQDQHGM
jgi:predicted SnoaL-like aldol condensation-catalyzing enzyme